MIAYDSDEKYLIISRNDISEEDVSATDSASGLIQRNGVWNFEN